MSRVPPFPLLWLSTATKNCLKDAVWTVLYQNQPFSGYFELQNTVLKMSFGIFDTERRGYEHLWLLQNFHCKADH